MEAASRKAPSPGYRLVSAIIPARNAAHHLSRAIESALAQSYLPMEVVVVDDASEDCTSQVAARYGNRVRLVRLARGVGPAVARNIGIEAALGVYVAFLDADDEWLPDKIARQVALIEQTPDMILVSCDAYSSSRSHRAPISLSQARLTALGREAWKILLAHPLVSTPTVLTPRDAVLRAGLFDPALPIGEDQDLWIRLARLGTVGYVEEALVRIHDTPGSVTKRRAYESVLYALNVVDRHVKAAAGELTDAEIYEIYAQRCWRLGRNAYEARAPVLGVRLLFRSVWLGRPALPVLAYLIAASPLGRFVKNLIRITWARYPRGRASKTDQSSSSSQ